ncbi:hypothetical protein, partial [Falsiroseomonas sp.]|uniref:hypothetical protein n=1 Tax=Falsiroseomonas sp. TaxID=2870721 RepID=UPI003F6EC920
AADRAALRGVSRLVARGVARVEARLAGLAARLVLLTEVPLLSSRLAASADWGARTSKDSRASRISRMR